MSNKNTFNGRVVSVGETETLGKNPDKPFYKRVIIIDDSDMDSKYPNPVPFEATGDKCQYLDKYKKGDEVSVEFYPSGRAWEDPKTGKTRYFSSNRIGFIKLADNNVIDNDDAGGVGGDDSDMPF